MASGVGGCSASERLPPPFPGLDPESEGATGGSEPEAGDSDTEGEDIFTGAAAAVSSPSGQPAGEGPEEKGGEARVGGQGREGLARTDPAVGSSGSGPGELLEAGPGFPAPGRRESKEGCGGLAAVPSSREPPRLCFDPAVCQQLKE